MSLYDHIKKVFAAANKDKKNARHQKNRSMRIEPLEKREMMTANPWSFAPGVHYDDLSNTVVVVGNNTADDIDVSQPGDLVVDFNGTQHTFTAADVDRVEVYSGDGDDTITGGTDLQKEMVIDAGAGDDTIYGGMVNDTITAGDGDDIIYGRSGNDVIYAGAGTDTVVAGLGDDTIEGNDGNDDLQGNDGSDTIDGGRGNDTVDGGDGDDAIITGFGADTAIGGTGIDTITGGTRDTLTGENVTVELEPVAQWQLDTDASDLTGANNGTLVGDATIATDATGRSFLSLDGDGDGVIVPDSAELDVTDNFTLATSLRIDDADAAGGMRIFSKKNIWTDASGFELLYDASVNEMRFGTAGESRATFTGIDLDENWHHVALTFSGGTATLFVDGIQVGSGTTAAITANNVNLQIGRYNDGTNPNACFAGQIDDAQIFGQALDATQVANLVAEKLQTLTPEVETTSFVVANPVTNATEVGHATAILQGDAPINYAITAGNDGGAFAIDATTGIITVADENAIDWATQSSYTLTVTATNAAALDKVATTNVQLVVTSDAGLLAEWGFEADATDGNGFNDATLGADATLVTDADRGNVLELSSASEAYAAIPVTETLNLVDDFSVATWMKVADPALNLNVRIFSSKTKFDSADGFELFYNASTDTLYFNTANSSRLTLSNVGIDGDWHHVTATLSGGTATIYIDGASVGSGTVDPIIASANPLLIGDYAFEDGYGLAGKFDDTQVYNQALSATEVADVVQATAATVAPEIEDATFVIADAIENDGPVGQVDSTLQGDMPIVHTITAGNDGGAFTIDATTGIITVADENAIDWATQSSYVLTVTAANANALEKTATAEVQIVVTSDTGLIAEWNFEGDATDSNGFNDATLGVDAATTFDVARGDVLDLDGTTESFASIPVNETLDFESDFSVAMWLKLTDLTASTSMRIFSSKSLYNSPDGFELAYNPTTDTLFFNTANASRVTVTNVALDDDWHHVAVTLTGGIATLYVDGVSIGNGAVDPIIAGSNPLQLGRYTNNDDASFIGKMDRVQVYNQALDAAEVAATAAATVEAFTPEVEDAALVISDTIQNTDTVGQVVAATEDGEPISYSITAGDLAGAFTIDTTTGVISVADESAIDFQTQSFYTLTITAANANAPHKTATGTVEITVTSATGLVAEWDYNGDATDSVGNNDATLGAGASIVNDVARSAVLELTSAANSKVTIPVSETLELVGDFSVATWMKIADPTTNLNMRIFSSKSTFDAPEGFELFYNPSTDTLIFNTAGTSRVTVTGVALDDNWHHLAVTVNGGTATLYVDGAEVGSGTVDPVIASTNPLLLGDYAPDSTYSFVGNLDTTQRRTCG